MTVTIQAIGQAAKRGAIPRMPSGERLLAEIDEWLLAGSGDMVRRHSHVALPGGGEAVQAQLHPAAEPIAIETGEGGRVKVTATTTPVGPGYHTFVARLIRRLGDEVSIDWAPASSTRSADGGTTGGSDETGYFESGDRRDAERGHMAWLGASLASIRDARRRGATGLHLGTPPGVHYTFEGAFASVLGPRDDAWLERALGDPRIAMDIWPWVSDAMDARYLLSRALCLIWLDVRWRPPADADETGLLDDVLALLRRGYPLDPELDWPWATWEEILALRGAPDPAGRALLKRASRGRAAVEAAPLGYRREPVTIVHEGWALEVPGTFAERRTDEEWWGGDAGRSITLAGTETGTSAGPMPAETFLGQVAGHLGGDALRHQDGPLVGRAKLSSDPSSGVEVGTVEGYSAIRGRGAAIRIVIEDPEDWKWALDMWRALRPA